MAAETRENKVNYKDCMAFQQRIYEKIDQTEQRTLERLEKMESALLNNMDGLRSRVYMNAGIIATISSIVIGAVFIILKLR